MCIAVARINVFSKQHVSIAEPTEQLQQRSAESELGDFGVFLSCWAVLVVNLANFPFLN